MDDNILEKWFDAKQKIQILEERIERYKKIIGKRMDNQHVNKIKDGSYSVERRNISRKYISKENMPSDLWQRYAKQTSSDAYYITYITKKQSMS